MFDTLIGASHTFDDDSKLEVIQVKHRDMGEVLITCMISHPNSLPRKTIKTGHEFIDDFGHLFGLKHIEPGTMYHPKQ